MRAATVAAEMAQALGVNMHLVMCADRGRSVDVRVGTDRFHTDWLTEAEQFLKDTGRRLGVEEITHAVLSGDPADELCEEARRTQARMLVVGNRRVQGVARVLGSVASDVMRQADCDVLIVNTTG